MARLVYNVTLGSARGDGSYRMTSARGGSESDLSTTADTAAGVADTAANTAKTSATTADTAVGSAQALQAAVTSAVSAAAANGVIAGDGTALGLVNAIQTAFNLLITSMTTAKAATATAKTDATTAKTDTALAKVATVAAKASSTVGDVILDVDAAVVTSMNQLQAALAEVKNLARGSGIV